MKFNLRSSFLVFILFTLLELPRYCLVGISVMIFGVLYWFVWRVVFPKVFGYELVPRKEELGDGTVVTVVSHLCLWFFISFLMGLWL